MKIFAATTNEKNLIIKAKNKKNALKYFNKIANLNVKTKDISVYSNTTNSHQANVEETYPELF